MSIGGGFEGFGAGLEAANAEWVTARWGMIPWIFTLTIAFSYLIGVASWPSMLLKVTATRDVRTARISFLAAALLISIVYFCLSFIGIYARIIFPGGVGTGPDQIPHADAAFPYLAGTIVPPVIAGLFLAGLLSAGLSTTEAISHVVAGGVSHDIVYGLRPTLPWKTEIKIFRLTLIISCLLATVLAMVAPPALIVIFSAYLMGVWGSALFVPLILGAHWKGITPKGGLAGIIGGTVVSTIFILPNAFAIKLFAVQGIVKPFLLISPAIWGVLASLILVVVVSHLTRKSKSKFTS